MCRRVPHPGLVSATLLSAAVGVATGQPAAEDEGPVIVGERSDGFKTFELDRLNASLDFYSRYLRSHQSSPGVPDRTDTELLFRESLGVSSRFFLGHENLIDVTADLSLGIEDNFVDNQSQGLTNEHETGLFTLFDVNALILGEGPAPVTLFARRNESLLDRAFAGSIDSRTTEFGASVRTFLKTVPTTLRFSHRILERDDQAGLTDETLTQDTFQLQSLWDSGTGHRISLNYDLDLVDEQRARTNDTSFTRHDAILVHTYQFGSDDQHDLRSQLRLFDQSGDFEQQRVRLFETLTLRHSPTLETRYDAVLESRETRGQSQQFASGLFTLRHELFDSLVTTFNAGGNHTALPDDDYTSTELLTGLNLEYTKRVPFGRLDLSLTLNFNHQDDSARGQTISFFDTPQVFPAAGPLLLSGRNIVPGSIEITNTAGTRRFAQGLDYTQLSFPDRIELRRVIGGPIGDGDRVLIDYDLGPEPAATIQTLAGGLSARYTVYEGLAAGLSPYAQFRDLSQNISPASADRTPFDSRVIRVGADYRFGLFTFNAEYENQDNSISPFDAARASARYEKLLGLNSFLRVDLSHETIAFGNGGSTIDFDRALAEWGYAFSNGMQIRIRGLYRHESDSVSGDSQGFEQSFEFSWRIRQTTIALSLRNSLLEGEDVNTDSQTAVFAIRRQF